MLGERTVNGNVDHDRIEVGRTEGTFSKLTVVVSDSDLEMIDFKVVFADKTEYNPKVSQYFREGARTRVIDLPPSEPVIRFIDFKYRNLPGGGRAKVQVWALKTGDGVRPPVWDSKGWMFLGEREVNGSVDRDRVDVGRAEGKFSKVNVVVTDSDLEMIDFKIVFADKTEYNPKVSQYFKEGARTRAIDLPPSEAIIRFIDFKYRNLPGGGRAKVQVWGWKTGEARPPVVAPVPAAWDNRGFTLLGEREVDYGRRADKDRIDVGRYEGKFTKLMLVVENSDLELLDFRVKFAHGPDWRPDVKQYFKEGARTRPLDFPGNDRAIKWIDIKYRNLPGGGKARMQVWGQRADVAPVAPITPVATPAAVWESKGWTMLGERIVDGRVDRDAIEVGRSEGKFRKLMLVVLDSDLELIDFSVKFGRGEPFHPAVQQVFRENGRTRSIDLPGDDRVIKWLEFKYKNLPGGGRARFQVWAK